MSDPVVRFMTEVETPSGETAKLVAIHDPASGRVAIGIEIGEASTVLTLDAAQAAALGLELLGADLDAAQRLAEDVPDRIAQQLAAVLLAPSVRRGLAVFDAAPEAS